MTEPVVIYRSKRKLFFLFLAILTFFIISILLFKNANEVASSKFSYSSFLFPIYYGLIKIFSLAGFFFFGLGVIYIPKELFNNKPKLIISEEGIYYNEKGGMRLIKWQDITSLETGDVSFGNKIIIIETKNDEEIISRLSGWEKLIAKINKRVFKCGFSISTVDLKYNPKQLAELLEEQFKLHRKSFSSPSLEKETPFPKEKQAS